MFVRLPSNWNQADTNMRARARKRRRERSVRTYLMKVSSPFNRTVGIFVIADYRVVFHECLSVLGQFTVHKLNYDMLVHLSVSPAPDGT